MPLDDNNNMPILCFKQPILKQFHWNILLRLYPRVVRDTFYAKTILISSYNPSLIIIIIIALIIQLASNQMVLLIVSLTTTLLSPRVSCTSDVNRMKRMACTPMDSDLIMSHYMGVWYLSHMR